MFTWYVGLLETLEADVRSKFQTRKQMEFSQMGHHVQVLFDETIVKFDWLELRKFEVIDIILASRDKETAEVLKKLKDVEEEVEEEEDVNAVLEKLDQLIVDDSAVSSEQPEM